MLFEMLTGQPAFGGEDVMTTLARVLANNADLASIPGSISPAVRRTLEMCLEKDPAKRIRHIGDVKLALQGKFDSAPDHGLAPAASPFAVLAKAGTAAMVLAAVAGGLVYYRMLPAAQPLIRFVHPVGDETPLRINTRGVFALAPNGRYFVYNTESGLFLRDMGELEARLIPGTEEFLASPAFSPDSKSLAYRMTNGPVKRIAVSGGAPVVVAEVPGNTFGMSWGADNNLYYASEGGIYRVSANGGAPELLIDVEGSRAQSPTLLPDGDTLLYTLGPPPATAMAHSLRSGESKELIPAPARDARYVDPGFIVYGRENDGLFALRFELASWTISGSPIPLVQDVLTSSGSAHVNYGIADDGTLAYVADSTPGTVDAIGRRSLVFVDREGNEEPLDLPLRDYDFVRVSPDGRRLVTTFSGDMWVADLARPVLSRITTTERAEFSPLWTQDSQAIVFAVVTERSLYRISADATGAAELLTQVDAANGLLAPGDWIGDEANFTFTYGPNGATDPRIGVFTLNPPNNDVPAWEPLIDRQAGAGGSVVAPGGEWIAYHADDAGEYGIYIERLPGLGSRQLVSDAAGGWGAYWSADGSELFYRRLGDGAMMAVSIQTTPIVEIGAPHVLFEGIAYLTAATPEENGGSQKYWGLAPDGRFLMIRDGLGGENDEEIVVVQHWIDELERLAPTE